MKHVRAHTRHGCVRQMHARIQHTACLLTQGHGLAKQVHAMLTRQRAGQHGANAYNAEHPSRPFKGTGVRRNYMLA